MGCGKSKHDVVAGNTVSQSKKSKDDHPRNNNIDHEGATSAIPPPPAVQQEANIAHGTYNGDVMTTNAKEGHKAALAGPSDGINDVKQGEKLLAEAGDQEGGKEQATSSKENESKKIEPAAADVSSSSSSSVVIKKSKNVDVNDEKAAKEAKVMQQVTMAGGLDLKEKKENIIIEHGTKEGEEELGLGGGGGGGGGRHDGSAGTNSNNNIEGIITDGLSGTTVYYSPPHTNTKLEVVEVEVEAEEIPKPAEADHHNLILADKQSVQETKMETTTNVVEIVTVTEEASIQVEVNIPAVESDKVAIATN